MTASAPQALAAPAPGSGRWRRAASAALRAPFSARTWRANYYALVGFVLAVPFCIMTLVFLGVSLVLTLTVLGLPPLALTGYLAIGEGRIFLGLSHRLLGVDIAPARSRKPQGGFAARLLARALDARAWRARAYLVLRLPLAALTVYVIVLGYLEGLAGVLYPVYWSLSGPTSARGAAPAAPLDLGFATFRSTNRPTPPLAHRLTMRWQGQVFDTWPLITLVVIGGLVVLLIIPWLVRGLTVADLWLQRRLLGPTAGERRIERLETARGVVAADAAATLRRIERDLHDGTQAQLVALAMTLGQAREELETPEHAQPGSALHLVTSAHEHAKQALEDLRSVARGIHPPALDVGLDNALSTLAARSAVPATLETELTGRPSPAIETIAYFSAAELLNNVAKHSGATHARLHVSEHDGNLLLTVSDDGCGGADPTRGTGLQGLRGRVDAVDGSLAVFSPPGGPTEVVVQLPYLV